MRKVGFETLPFKAKPKTNVDVIGTGGGAA